MSSEKSIRQRLKKGESFDLKGLKEEVNKIDKKIGAIRSKDFSIMNNGGELRGLPVSVKDNICVEGFPATAGSKILETYRPEITATVVKKIQNSGGNIFAKTNQDEFGFGTFSMNSAFEIPKNPYDTERVTGGSSGGAAALTSALDQPHVALGQSTGGSISNPAAFCGVVGITPTYGKVSRYGLIDYANSLDKIGTMAQRVEDAALILDIISGKDEKDFTTLDRGNGSLAEVKPDVKGMKIAVPRQYIEFEGMDKKVREKFWDSIGVYEDLGAEVEEVDMPKIAKEYVVPTYYIIAMSEASTNLAKFCGMRYGIEKDTEKESFNEYFSEIRSEGFGDEVKRRVLLGHFLRQEGYKDAYYIKALKVRRLIIEEYKETFKNYDIIASPTMPIIAPKIAEARKTKMIEIYAMDTLTVGPNLAGIPHLSVPCGKVDRMPVGMHLIGDHFREDKIVAAAKAFESDFGTLERPKVV